MLTNLFSTNRKKSTVFNFEFPFKINRFVVSQVFTITLGLLLSCSIVSACDIYDIVSVQSISIKPYNDAVKSFEDNCDCKVRQLVMSETGHDDVLEHIHETKPDLIIAIGMKALKTLLTIRDIPVVSLMVLDPGSFIPDNKNIIGIDLFITPEKQLTAVKDTFPDAETVGIVYDPLKTGYFIKDILHASESGKIKIVAKEIHRAKEFPSLLENMKDDIDVLWMIPDMTVITPEAIEYAFAFSIENNIPIITFAEKYLEMGALVSFDIDIPDAGKQAWEVADRILSGTEMDEIENTYTRNFNVTINKKIARNYGIIPVGGKLIKAVAIKQKRQNERR